MIDVVVEQTNKIPLREFISRCPIGRVPLAFESVDQYIRWSDQTFTVKVEGEVACVWGIIRLSILSGEGYLWFLSAEIAEEHKFVLIRRSQRTIEDLLKMYTKLIGDCLVTDRKAQRWMRLLGAEFDFPVGDLVPFKIERR
ncbi:MAG: hypothetical protein LAO23_19705 [Acidobacteriia bacterium]|nr:hypothetical protein [Terriglobia bacterium]